MLPLKKDEQCDVISQAIQKHGEFFEEIGFKTQRPENLLYLTHSAFRVDIGDFVFYGVITKDYVGNQGVKIAEVWSKSKITLEEWVNTDLGNDVPVQIGGNQMIELRGAEAEDILRDIAFKIINNMGLMEDIKIHCFPGAVTLTTTLTVCGGRAFAETVAEESKRIMEDQKVQHAELTMTRSKATL